MNQKSVHNQAVGVLVWFLVAYLAWDFVRPHDIVPPLKYTRFSMILTVILVFPIVNKVIENGLVTDKIIAGILVFFLLCYLSLLWVYNQGYWRVCFRGSIFILIIQCLGLAVLADTRQRMFFVIRGLVVFHVFIAIYGILNHGRGPGSFLDDENDLALALNTMLPMAYFLSFDSRVGRFSRWFFILSAAVMLLCVVASNSRGGFLGLAAAIGVCFLLTQAKRYFIYAVLVFGLVVAPFVTDKYLEEMSTITDTGESTADERLWSWKLALDMYKDNPILGVGMCNYRNRVAEYEILGIGGKWGEIRKSLVGRVSHSIYFTILPELGAVGMGVFILIVYRFFSDMFLRKGQYEAYDPEDLIRRGLIAGMTGYLVSGAFLTVIYTYPQFWMICGLAVALKRLNAKNRKSEKNDNSYFYSGSG